MHSVNRALGAACLLGSLVVGGCEDPVVVPTDVPAPPMDAGPDAPRRVIGLTDASIDAPGYDASGTDAPPLKTPRAEGEACRDDTGCESGTCRARGAGLQTICVLACSGGCSDGYLCDGASGYCFPDTPLGGACDAVHHDLNGDPVDGCEYACVGGAEVIELCNGVDDDCDGGLDESFPGAGEACELAGCGAGVRVCASGVPVCQRTSPGSAVEICNGVDDDCDGTTDEGCPHSFTLTGARMRGPGWMDPGGSGFDFNCADGQLVYSIGGRAGSVVDRFTVNCTAFGMQYSGGGAFGEVIYVGSPGGVSEYGGSGGTPFPAQSCPLGSVMVGINVRAADQIDGVQPLCASLQWFQYESAPRASLNALNYYGGGGGSPYQFVCPAGQVVVGFWGATGTNVDQLGVNCRPYSISHY